MCRGAAWNAIERVVTGASREEANARERDGVWISTLLLPGLNLVGWLESPILTQGIFDAIPQAQAIWVWDAHRHRWRFARSGDSVSGDLEHPRTGMGFSMRVGGRDPIQWERRLAMTDSAITAVQPTCLLPAARILWPGRDGRDHSVRWAMTLCLYSVGTRGARIGARRLSPTKTGSLPNRCESHDEMRWQ